MNIIDTYFRLQRRELFAGIILINLLLIWFSQTVMINETVFFNTYSAQLTYSRSMQLFDAMKALSWISYLFTPLIFLIKVSVLSLIIYTGVFFYDRQKEITLGMVFTTVIASEVIIVLGTVAKLLWFIFSADAYTLNDLNFFYPLSLINLFRQSEVASYWIYPLQTVSLFQVLYILMLATGLSKISCVRREISDKIILATYIPALVFWVALIMFLTIDN